MQKHSLPKNIAITASGIAVVSIVAGIIFLGQENSTLKEYSSLLTTELASTTAALTIAETDNADLREALDAEQKRNEDFEDQIDEIADTVGVLDKLSSTDPELLQKYSKVYFLNENYIPEKLANIDADFLAPGKKDLTLEARVNDDLENMFEAAAEDGINLRVISAYRSFWDQQSLKSAYTVTYGATSANRFSADQGYSEHQLGTTVDLTTEELGLNYTTIETTEAYEWLNENAFNYGFILSYPKGNDYYVFEPWHWRFVGKKLARELHRGDRSFYDLEQRELDEYLVTFFD